jgi:catabolite repression HPr-like protein
MITKSVTVGVTPDINKHPAALFVQLANQFESAIHIHTGSKKINAKSIMGVMTLNLSEGEVMEVSTNGADEIIAMQKIENFLGAEPIT